MSPAITKIPCCIQLETQVKPEVTDIGIQCDLLSPMPISTPHHAADLYKTDAITIEEGIYDGTYAPFEDSLVL